MDTVKQKPKETDITGVLVLVLVLLVGTLIAKMSMDFTSKPKTTASQAAPPRKSGDSDCAYMLPLAKGSTDGFSYPGLVTQYDYCPSAAVSLKRTWGSCKAGYIKDTTTTCKANVLKYSCCRSAASVNFSALGDTACKSKYGENSTCKATCGTSTQLSAQNSIYTGSSSIKAECGYLDGDTFKPGVCCSTGPTATPTPFQAGISKNSCLIDGVRYDCEASLKSASSNTQGLTAECVSVNAYGSQTYRCGYVVDPAYSNDVCNGQQWVNGYVKEDGTKDSGCYVGNTGQKKIRILNGPNEGKDACMLIKNSEGRSDLQCQIGMGMSDTGQQ